MPSKPILQILGIKKLQASKGVDRYRAVLSDGVHYYTSSMLATQLNEMVESKEIEGKTIVQVNQFNVNTMQATRKVIVVLDMTVLQKSSEVAGKLGSPEQLSDQISVLDKMAAEMDTDGDTKMNIVTQSKPVPSATSGGQLQNRGDAAQGKTNPYGGAAFYGGGPKSGSKGSDVAPGCVVHPISSLTPYQNRWMIRVRVTNKSGIRKWSNSKGEGKLFSVDLLDESGEIKATGFNDAVDRFYDLLETGKVYYFSKASLKSANKLYSSLKNNYEMSLNNDTIITLCTEDVDLPQVQFNFVNIGDLENVNKDALVDIIGVVKTAADVMQITTKATNRQVSKRELSVVDRSETSVNVTLWGDQAESFEKHVNSSPVIAVKGAKVSDFGGRSLSVLNSSLFNVNPDIEEAHLLRGWYDQIGKDSGMKSISGQRSDGAGGQFKTISQIASEKLGFGEKADYFNIRVVPVFFKKDNCLYQACPSAECNKKVIGENGEYRCERCNRTYAEFQYRFIMQANVCDCTGNQWLTFFQESGEAILNNTAEHIGRLLDTDEEAASDVFSEALLKPVILKIRAKLDTYNDESRLRATCTTATPLDFKTDAKRLMEEIRKLEAI